VLNLVSHVKGKPQLGRVSEQGAEKTWENCVINYFLIYRHTSAYIIGDQIKENEVDTTCRMHRRVEKYIHNSSLKIRTDGGT
jgi:hypothetical protein